MSDSQSDQQPRGFVADKVIEGFQTQMVQTVICFVLYGVYSTLCAIILYSFLVRGRHQTKARVVLFIITAFVFLLSTCSQVLSLEYNLLWFTTFSYNPPDPAVLGPVLVRMSIAQNAFERTNYMISDGIVVWRAWVFYPGNRYVKLGLTICMLASVAGTLSDIIAGDIRRIRDPDDVGSPLDILKMTVPLLVTNIFATSLIAYKLWCYHHTLKHNLAASNSSFAKVQKVMMLLVESGFVYCILWIIYTSVTLNVITNSHSWQTYARVLPMLAALYPVLIILLVYLESSKENAQDRMSLSQSIRFASAPPEADNNHTSHVDLESQNILPKVASVHVMDEGEVEK